MSRDVEFWTDLLDVLGPFDGRNIILVRDGTLDEEHLDTMLEHLIEQAQARGETGNAAAHVPLIVCLGEGMTMELLDEEAMAAYGWVRADDSFKGS